jgi:hypothetical protein
VFQRDRRGEFSRGPWQMAQTVQFAGERPTAAVCVGHGATKFNSAEWKHPAVPRPTAKNLA